MSPDLAVRLFLEWGTLGGVVVNAIILFKVERRLFSLEKKVESDPDLS